MLKIIVCEDQIHQRSQFESLIYECLEELSLMGEIVLSTASPTSVMDFAAISTENHPIFFLDIHLGTKMNGIDLAKNINTLLPDAYIVFFTSNKDFSVSVLKNRIQTTDFIVKDTPRKMKPYLLECLIYISENLHSPDIIDGPFITLHSNSLLYKMYENQIVFIETFGIATCSYFIFFSVLLQLALY